MKTKNQWLQIRCNQHQKDKIKLGLDEFESISAFVMLAVKKELKNRGIDYETAKSSNS